MKIPYSKVSKIDWMDLVLFVIGDLQNMPQDDEVRIQIRMILDEILKEISK